MRNKNLFPKIALCLVVLIADAFLASFTNFNSILSNPLSPVEPRFVPTVQGEEVFSTPDLIEQAFNRGEITAEKRLLYLAFALSDYEKLPVQFRSNVPWSGTLVALELSDSIKSKSEKATQSNVTLTTIQQLFSGACGPYSNELPNVINTAHFYVEYDSIAGSLDINAYTSALENAWNSEVFNFGWAQPPALSINPPPNNLYHVRIQSLPTGLTGVVYEAGLYAGLVGDNPNTSWDDVDSQASCMILNRDYTPFFVAGYGTEQEVLYGVAVHEYLHSIQFGYGALTGPNAPDHAFAESSAAWMEEEVPGSTKYSINNQYMWPTFDMCMGEYQYPEETPDTFFYTYWHVFRGLTEPFGVGSVGGGEDVMQDFWEETSKSTNSNMLSALNTALVNKGTTLADAYHNYAIVSRFTKSCPSAAPYCFEDAAEYVAEVGANKNHGRIWFDFGSYPGNLADNYAINWIGLPASGIYSISLKNTSAGGEFRGSIVADMGNSLHITPFPNIASGNSSTTIINYQPPAGAESVVAVITNQSQTSDNPASCAENPYELQLQSPVLTYAGSSYGCTGGPYVTCSAIVTDPQPNPSDRLDFDITFAYEDDWDAGFTSVFGVSLDFLTSVYDTNVPIYWKMVPIDNDVMPYRSITTVYSGTADLDPMDYPKGDWVVPGQPWPYDKFTVNFSNLTGFGETLIRTDKWHLAIATYDINCLFSDGFHQLLYGSNDANASGGFAFAASTLERIAGQAPLLYRVRDEVLSAEGGQHYIDLYYANSAEIADIMNAHSELAEQGLDVIDALAPNLQAILDEQGDTVTITTSQVQQAQAFLDAILPYASPELQQAIADEQALQPLEQLSGMTMNEAQDYLFDTIAPIVVSSTLASANPTAAATVDFSVTFSESVTGVDAGDFVLTTTGVSGASISGVSGSGATYTVSVNTGIGNGTIRLDVVDDDTIVDTASNPLGGADAGNGSYASGQSYAVDKVAPTVSTSMRSPTSPIAASSVKFTVNFSESVVGVDIPDFSLTTSGSVTGASVSVVNGSGDVYVVTVNTGSGSGTIRLDVVDDDTIVGAASNPLGGAGVGNGDFTSGQVYTISALTVNSFATQDGYVLESGENSNVGGSMNAAGLNFPVGDDGKDKQYRGVLHFNTAGLPDTAIITSVTLTIKQQGAVTGTSPFITHGSLTADIRKPYFSTSENLQTADFQAAPGQFCNIRLRASWHLVQCFVEYYWLSSYKLDRHHAISLSFHTG